MPTEMNNTCATCKSWSPFGHPVPKDLVDQNWGNWDNGECNHEELPFDFTSDRDVAPWTPSDFGCILHKPRGPICPSCGRPGLHSDDCDDCARHRA